jgi:predicted dehydrogenase
MLNVGVIGVGHLGKHHARIYAGLNGVRLVGVADIVPERSMEIAGEFSAESFTDFEDLFGKVDAVSIAAPTEEHARIGRRCLESGIDVLIEKPIASNLDTARSLIESAHTSKRILQVGHVERFNPVVRAAQQVATRPQFFEVHRLSVFSMRSLDIDVVLDLMIHDIDIVLCLVDRPVVEIRAVGIPVLSDKADIANVRIEFEDGCVANLTASRVSTDKVRKLRFFQPHDYVSLDYAAQEGSVLSLEGGRITQQKLRPPHDEPLRAQLEAFIACVEERGTPAVTGEDGLRALEIALSINDEIVARGARTPKVASASSGGDERAE